MQKTFNNPYFSDLKRVVQKTNAHCGPAVLEMLVRFVGIDVDQDEFVDILGIAKKLPTHGMTIYEMGQAITKLLPNLQFWYKHNSSLNDLSQMVNNFRFPAGVEWQGVFYEDSDEDNGHYGAVTHINTAGNIVTLADPYKRFAGTDRAFHVLEFEDRWWDENEVKDPLTHKVKILRDYHTMFIVTPKEETFPENLGMIKG